ncbi:MAG: ABC transporter permease [Dehalococcoidia bacterium]
MSAVLAIAGVNLRRVFRDRANVFFILIFPLLIIVVLGLTFGSGFDARIGILVPADAGPLVTDLVGAIDAADNVIVDRFDDEDALLTAVERGRVQAGLVIPPGYGDAVGGSGTVALRYYARPDRLGQELRPVVDAALAGQAARVVAARFLAAEGLASIEDGLALAASLAPVVPGPQVAVERVGEAALGDSFEYFDLGASQQLLLFIFLTSLTSAVALIETRQFGISRRMLSTPTSAVEVVAGEALGRFAIALTQGLLIMLGSLVLFQVNWGDPLGAAAVLIAFSLVGSGAGMLAGAALSNTQQAGALGLLLGLGLGALGGSMVPLEVFPETMRRMAHVTPHAWGSEAFATLVRHDGSLFDILPELGVLFAMATVLYVLAAWRLRRAIMS